MHLESIRITNEETLGPCLPQMMVGSCLPQSSESWGVPGDLLTAQGQKGGRFKPQAIPGKGLCIELLGWGIWEGLW